jgi:hypothetical protein
MFGRRRAFFISALRRLRDGHWRASNEKPRKHQAAVDEVRARKHVERENRGNLGPQQAQSGAQVAIRMRNVSPKLATRSRRPFVARSLKFFKPTPLAKKDWLSPSRRHARLREWRHSSLHFRRSVEHSPLRVPRVPAPGPSPFATAGAPTRGRWSTIHNSLWRRPRPR